MKGLNEFKGLKGLALISCEDPVSGHSLDPTSVLHVDDVGIPTPGVEGIIFPGDIAGCPLHEVQEGLEVRALSYDQVRHRGETIDGWQLEHLCDQFFSRASHSPSKHVHVSHGTDGEAMDGEAMDGEAMDGEAMNGPTSQTGIVPSKTIQVQSVDHHIDSEQSISHYTHGPIHSASGSASGSASCSASGNASGSASGSVAKSTTEIYDLEVRGPRGEVEEDEVLTSMEQKLSDEIEKMACALVMRNHQMLEMEGSP